MTTENNKGPISKESLPVSRDKIIFDKIRNITEILEQPVKSDFTNWDWYDPDINRNPSKIPEIRIRQKSYSLAPKDFSLTVRYFPFRGSSVLLDKYEDWDTLYFAYCDGVIRNLSNSEADTGYYIENESGVKELIEPSESEREAIYHVDESDIDRIYKDINQCLDIFSIFIKLKKLGKQMSAHGLKEKNKGNYFALVFEEVSDRVIKAYFLKDEDPASKGLEIGFLDGKMISNKKINSKLYSEINGLLKIVG